MKNLKFTLLAIILLIPLIKANAQYLPAINRIDTMEKSIVNKYGDNWLVNFYRIWEVGKTDPDYNEIMINNKDGNRFKSLLEDDLDCFIIDGKLFAISYKPDITINEDENNKRNAYDFCDIHKHHVWIYEKNVKVNNELWFTANNAPLFNDILGENCEGNGVSYCSQKAKGMGEHYIIKSNKYKGYVVLICGLKSDHKYSTKIITFSLTPVEGYPNSYVYYQYGNNDQRPYKLQLYTYMPGIQSYYPVKFTGQNKNGTISTISNTGKVETIDLYLGKDLYGRTIDNVLVSFNSEGYGWSWVNAK